MIDCVVLQLMLLFLALVGWAGFLTLAWGLYAPERDEEDDHVR